jgi:glycosyltransferase involved in cell wall biosynthesis
VNICYVSQQVGEVRTGVGTYARALVPAVVDAGHEATIVGRGAAPGWPGVAFHAVPRAAVDPTPEGWVSFARAAARRIRGLEGRFDVVHFLDAREALSMRRPPAPLVGTAHDAYLASAPASPGYWRARYTDWPRRWLYHRLARRLERRALRRLDALVTNSDWVRDAVVARYALRVAPCRTVYIGLAAAAPVAPSAALRAPHLLFVGVNFQRKGLPTLLRALAALRADVPAVRLTVVGDHPTRADMEALARTLGVADAVRFTGLLAPADVAACYATARVLVLPSEVEGFGLTLLEAMQRGVPVVAGAEGGSRELVRDGVNGVLVPPGDVATLAARLRALLTDDGLCARLAAAGRETAAAFTPARMAAETLAVYGELLERRACRA